MIFSIGLKLITILEKVHKAGVIFNDLKMDNILVSDPEKPADTLVLIDFGLATMFRAKDGSHIQKSRSKKFEGNIIFSSLNQMNFMAASRRDDLIGLCYMLVYLLKRGNVQFSGIKYNEQLQAFKFVKVAKMNLENRDLVGPIGSASWPLLDLVNLIFGLEFDEEPCYVRYRLMLLEVIHGFET